LLDSLLQEMNTRFREKNVNEKDVRLYVEKDAAGDGRLTRAQEGRGGTNRTANRLSAFFTLLRTMFLPEGYPDTVSEDYIYYQGWDTVQAFASSISGSLATAAVLEGVGVGDETATPLAASLTWILRDGTGMVGRILFAARCGVGLDYDCKKWRLCADVLNDVAMLIEIITPRLRKDLTLPVLCLASLARSIVGVAGGATKAAVAQHQAKNQNMADLSAKDGSQETMVNLLALLVNLTILPVIADHKDLVMPLFLLLTALHIFANYKAVRSLEFGSLNLGRLSAILEEYTVNKQILGIKEANRRESLAFHPSGYQIRLGVSLSVLSSDEVCGLGTAINNNRPTHLVIRPGCVLVFVSTGASSRDVLIAFMTGWAILHNKLKLSESEASTILAGIEGKGWGLDRLALQSEGFTYLTSNTDHQD